MQSGRNRDRPRQAHEFSRTDLNHIYKSCINLQNKLTMLENEKYHGSSAATVSAMSDTP